MTRWMTFVACACLLSLPLASTAVAQHGQQGTVVQLPTFSFFTVSTTVLAPDSGRGYVGGMSRAGRVRPSFGLGPLRNHGLTRFDNAAGVHVAAQIHDLRWMDQMLLNRSIVVQPQQDEYGLAERSSLAKQLAEQSSATSRSSQVADAYGAMHINDIRRLKAERNRAEAERLIAKGDLFRQRGSASLASTFYKQALPKLEGDRLEEIRAIVEELESKSQSSQSGKSGGR